MDNKHAPSFCFSQLCRFVCVHVCIVWPRQIQVIIIPSSLPPLNLPEHVSPIRQSVKRHHDLA